MEFTICGKRIKGTVRYLDKFNKILLPKEMIDNLELQPKSPIEIFQLEDGTIVLIAHKQFDATAPINQAKASIEYESMQDVEWILR